MSFRGTLATLFVVGSLPIFGQPADSSKAEFFEARIRPLLAKNCFHCHTDSHMGGLRLDSREALLKGGNSGPSVVPGDPDASLLIRAVDYTHERLKMPADGNKLSSEEIDALKVWVKAGAAWPQLDGRSKRATPGGRLVILPTHREFWAFRPVRKAPEPPVQDTVWPRSAIDRFILAKLETAGLKPARLADKRTLIRRATFDLIGLPPTPNEVDAFLSDNSADAFVKVVDRLLGSPHYGERWGRYWLDLARYSDGQIVKTHGQPPPSNAFRYRDWVVQALNQDMPYDRFIKAQLAADLLPEPNRTKLLPALGFHALGPTDEDDRVDVTTRTFLALTVGCAKCHDHKLDPIPTVDYYSLLGVFKATEPNEYPLAPDEVVSRYQKVQQQIKDKEEELEKFVKNQRDILADILLGQTEEYMVTAWKVIQAEAEARQSATEHGLDRLTLERWIRYLQNPDREHPFLKDWDRMIARGASLDEVQAFARQFRQLVLTVNAEKKAMEERNLVKLGGAAGYKDKKVRDLVNIEFLEPKKWSLWRDLADDPCKTGGCQCGLPFEGGITFYGDKGDEHHGYYRLNEEQKIDRFLTGEWKRHLDRLRSEVDTLKKSLPPPYPLLLGYRDSKEPKDVNVAIRGDESNPGEPAPRRFLQILSQGEPKLFMRGSGRMELAEAIADPRNPLTARAIVNRIWYYHFGQGIVRTVSNFGQLGERPSHPELLDYLASLFVESGWSLKKLHREIMLSGTYALSTEHIAGNFEKDPDNRLHWRANFIQRLDAEALRDAILYAAGTMDVTIGGPALQSSDEHRRRTLYSLISRADLDRMLLLFDFPDPNSVPEQRVTTAGPLQKLYFLNSSFVMTQAQALAERLQKESNVDDTARIRRAYQLLYARPPAEKELSLGLSFVRRGNKAWPQYLQALLAASEFSSVN